MESRCDAFDCIAGLSYELFVGELVRFDEDALLRRRGSRPMCVRFCPNRNTLSEAPACRYEPLGEHGGEPLRR